MPETPVPPAQPTTPFWRGQLRPLLHRAAVLVPMALVVGSLCAAFLWSLDAVTRLRFAHPWLVWLLPVGGLAIGWLYQRWAGRAEAGNNLIVDEIHQPGGGVPWRMAPLIFLGTVGTHLFGGSAGREGTAVQIGGSVASGMATLARVAPESRRILLMAGVAAGFGAVFGTPLAGAVFAMEVLAVGRVEYAALVPCLIAAILADWACHQWGITHPAYTITYGRGAAEALRLNLPLLAEAALAGAVSGLVARAFAEANHALGGLYKRHIAWAPLRPFVGGLVVLGLVWLTGTRDFLGLGILPEHPGAITLPGFFTGPADSTSWALKFLFTVATLSAGFKGGEVTPLFFIGAGLGSALAGVLGAPVDLFAGLGFVAVFAGAANTPLACTLMGIELFGAAYAMPVAAACFVAYLCSGHGGIYLSQRIAVAKLGGLAPATLREARVRQRR